MAVVVVTGCSSGFGRALARGFVERGDTVVATMRRPEAAGDLNERAHVLPLDVTDARSRTAAVQAVLAQHDRIDVLINNAGILHLGSVEDTPEEMARAVFETNYFGAVTLSKEVAPHLRRQGSGRIVNVTAIGAMLCTPFLSAYCASKHALDAAGACMDIELRPFGVRVSSVLPGSFRTAIGGHAVEAQDSQPYAPYADAFRQGFLARLAGAPQDLSEFVDVTITAATLPDPLPRYVVGGGAAYTIRPVVDGLADLHAAEVARAGLARAGSA